MKKDVTSFRQFLAYAGALIVIFASFMVVEAKTAQAANRALLVGVEEYPNPKMNLRGVRDDVNLLERALTKTGLFAKNEIKVLLDKQAAKANVIDNFKKWLIADSKQGSTVLFYFSGHGTRVWDEKGEKPDGMDSAVVCWDTTIVRPKVRRVFRGVSGEAFELSATRNLLLGREFHQLMKQLQGRRVIFMSDSCHSGTVYKQVDPFFVQVKTIDDEPVEYKSVFEERTSSVPQNSVVLKAPRIVYDFEIPGVEFIAFTASEDSQPAQVVKFEADPRGYHSVFTWFLLHGLEKAGDRSGVVTFGRLAEFIGHAVKRAGFAQDPQAVFSPRAVAEQPIVRRPSGETQRPGPESTPPRQLIERPTSLSCFLESGPGVSSSELQKLKSRLARSLPVMKWSDKKDQVSCRVVLEKVSGNFGARLSDASGDYWETNQGPDLEAVASALAGNLRAYYVQTFVTSLKNPKGQRSVAMSIAVKGPKQRVPGEAVQGDSVVLGAETKTGGYPFVFSVDTLGMIHPLYPIPNSELRELKPGSRGFLGSEGSFTVAEPFGKEMIFAITLDRAASSLVSRWAQDTIGDAKQESFEPQQRFLDTLWNELIVSGEPKGDWTLLSWTIRSFRK